MEFDFTTLQFVLLILSILVAIVTLLNFFTQNNSIKTRKKSVIIIIPKGTSKTEKGVTYTNQNDGKLHLKFFPEIGIKDILLEILGPTFIADYSFNDIDFRSAILSIDSNDQLAIEIIERR